MLSVTTITTPMASKLNKTRFTQKGESSGKVRRTTLKTTTMAKLSSSSSSVTIAKSSSSHNNNNNKNIKSRREQHFLINKGRRNTGALVVKASEGG